MRYAPKNCHDHWEIRDEDADCVAGIIMRKFAVYNDNNVQIAVVSSIDEAVETLARHDNKHSRRWLRVTTKLYAKQTRYGYLRLELDQAGWWSASRNDCPLCDDGSHELARFASLVEAKRVADAHLREGYASYVIVDDYLSWSTNTVE
jgi:hypothetical protein